MGLKIHIFLVNSKKNEKKNRIFPPLTLGLFNHKKLFFFTVLMFMFFSAVKFGRMSKKQREKVEEEVSFHQAAHHRQVLSINHK